MITNSEYVTIVIIAICLSLASGYLWGYAHGVEDTICYNVAPGEDVP